MILVTGFEPFGNLTHNPSAALMELLPQELAGRPLHKAILPVNAVTLPQVLKDLHALKPQAVFTWAWRRQGRLSPWNASQSTSWILSVLTTGETFGRTHRWFPEDPWPSRPVFP